LTEEENERKKKEQKKVADKLAELRKKRISPNTIKDFKKNLFSMKKGKYG